MNFSASKEGSSSCAGRVEDVGSFVVSVAADATVESDVADAMLAVRLRLPG